MRGDLGWDEVEENKSLQWLVIAGFEEKPSELEVKVTLQGHKDGVGVDLANGSRRRWDHCRG